MPSAAARPGRRQLQLAALGERDEAVVDEPAEHLARRLRADAELPGDLRRGDPRAVAGHDPQREQVLLRGAGEVAPSARCRPSPRGRRSWRVPRRDASPPRSAARRRRRSTRPRAGRRARTPPAARRRRRPRAGTRSPGRAPGARPSVPPTNSRASGGQEQRAARGWPPGRATAGARRSRTARRRVGRAAGDVADGRGSRKPDRWPRDEREAEPADRVVGRAASQSRPPIGSEPPPRRPRPARSAVHAGARSL